MTEEEKRATAYHEAGHALLNVVLPNTDTLHKVSIIPRGPALGVTMYLPEKDRITNWKKELLDRLIVIMGGRVAEEIFLGDVSSGASGDIQMATSYAKAMVCEWGMSEKLGMVPVWRRFLHELLRTRCRRSPRLQRIDRAGNRPGSPHPSQHRPGACPGNHHHAPRRDGKNHRRPSRI